MKFSKRLGHIIGIGLLILMMGYIFWTQSTDDNRMQSMLVFTIMISFVFFGYWRIYQFYKLEKMQKIHNTIDFVDYFDNMDFIMMGLKHAVLPLPIWKKLTTDEENKIRTTINIATVMVYLLLGLLIYLSIDFKQ